MFSKNVIIDYMGKVTLLLGDYFSIPDNFEQMLNDGDSEFDSIV